MCNNLYCKQICQMLIAACCNTRSLVAPFGNTVYPVVRMKWNGISKISNKKLINAEYTVNLNNRIEAFTVCVIWCKSFIRDFWPTSRVKIFPRHFGSARGSHLQQRLKWTWVLHFGKAGIALFSIPPLSHGSFLSAFSWLSTAWRSQELFAHV